MSGKKRYELGYNWSTGRESVFTRAVAEAARRRRIRCLQVLRDDADRVRHGVDTGRLEIGLFLNTQADVTRFNAPPMLLCRAIKSSGALVVEDPDDAHVYGNRALQLDSLHRAGLPVPRHFVVEDWRPDRRALTAAQRAALGAAWTARPAVGLGGAELVSTATAVSPALARHGLRPGRRVLICRHHRPAGDRKHVNRVGLWHLFGHVIACGQARDADAFTLLRADDLAAEHLADLVNIAAQIATITGLDWFRSELVVTRLGKRRGLLIVEPANALAGLGPGLRPLARIPAEAARLAAERLVEVAWRHAAALPLADGMTLCLDRA